MSRALLAVFLAIADATLAFSYGRPVAWALILLPAAAMIVRLPRVPPGVARVLTWISWGLVAVVGIRGDLVGWPAGVALAALAGVFLMDDCAFPAGRAFLPAALGVFLAAASNTSAPHFTLVSWLATAVLALWLVSALRATIAPRRLTAALLFAIPCFAFGHGLIVFLPWAQPRVEQAAMAYMEPDLAGTGLSIGARLGDIEKLALSRRVVLRMWSGEPANLRAGVYTQFDGRAWQPPRTVPSRLLGSGIPVAAAPASARFVVEEQTPGFLPAPSGVEAVQATEGPIALDAFGLVHAPAPPPATYEIRYAPGPIPLRQGDEDIISDCLKIPPRTDARVLELARQLGPDIASAKEKIARTLAHVQARCRYTLDVGRFTTQDPVAEFLFEKKMGYCEYFASATVLLLRLQGVPARYVNGLSVRDADRRGDHYVVRASDAHAWAEALVPGVGWVEVDSTPPGDYASLHAGQESWLEDVSERLRSAWADARAVQKFFPWLLAVVVVILVVRRLRRRKPRPERPAQPSLGVAPELAACLRRLEALWMRAGCPRPVHRAPLEHAGALPLQQVSAELRTLSLDLVEHFYRGAYGGEDIAAQEISRLSRALDRLSG